MLKRSLFKAMSATTRHRFFVYAPDKIEEGTLERRLSVREEHIAAAEKNIANGLIRVGGMVTTPDTMLAEKKHMLGSTFIYEAASIEEVEGLIKEDIYYKSGVWDPEKIVILPFFALTTIP